MLKSLENSRETKSFPVYDEDELFPDEKIKKKIIDKIIIKRE